VGWAYPASPGGAADPVHTLVGAATGLGNQQICSWSALPISRFGLILNDVCKCSLAIGVHDADDLSKP
jgi:hypothetical protein